MYEKVKTKRQQESFAKTWEYFCKQYGWYNDPYTKVGTRYNLLYKKNAFKKNEVIGTLELIPYKPNTSYSTVDGPGRAAFNTYKEFRINQNRVWEIDKLCIHTDFQRKGYFYVFIQIILEHAKSNRSMYLLALTEKKLFRMLKMQFGSFVEQKGNELPGPTTALVPTVIHIGKVNDVLKTIRTQSKNSFIVHSVYNQDTEKIVKLALLPNMFKERT
ncbi:hypothetical protein ACLIBH_05945 [Virgibacillus sp. W0430]|uniref:hypothetical protein n=1 Tax=Virgibacillus sp. W0430 TaxID=3391580 RepID=UPI003F45B927